MLAPAEDFVKGRPELNWEVVSVSPTSQNLIQSIEEKLREEEWMVYEWSPIHLRKVLNDWYLKDGVTEVSAVKVWQNTCHYLYLPRLVNDQVFRNAISQGVETEDFFGFASGKEDDRYLGFSFGKASIAPLDESSLLIERETAAVYAEKLRRAQQPTPLPRATDSGSTDIGGTVNAPGNGTPPGATPGVPGGAVGGYGTDPAAAPSVAKSHFYGTVEFTAQLGVDVTISVEIEARKKDGFDESLQRTIKENCNVLRFSSSEFEED